MPDATEVVVPAINIYRLNQCYTAFVEFVTHATGGHPFTTFAHPYIDKEENYKYEVRQEALSILDVQNWTTADIGTGRLIDRMITAIEQPKHNNLVQTRKRLFLEAQRYHRSLYHAQETEADRIQYETLLFQFFKDEIDDAQAMKQFIDLAGRKYSFIAYFYFLKDDRRYMPIAPDNFETIFEKLGLVFKLSGKCSWGNYQAYNQLVKQVRDFLGDQLEAEVKLLDAHSFLWILKDVPDPVAASVFTPATPCTTKAASVPTKQREASTPVDFEAWQQERSKIGRWGEDYVVNHEREALIRVGRADLAEKVERITDHTLGFDVRSYELDGSEKQIEVKTVSGKGTIKSFYLTQNELEKSACLENPYLYFVVGINNPFVYYIRKPDYQNKADFQMEVVNYKVTVELVPSDK